jgi:hypothetical protein
MAEAKKGGGEIATEEQIELRTRKLVGAVEVQAPGAPVSVELGEMKFV